MFAPTPEAGTGELFELQKRLLTARHCLEISVKNRASKSKVVFAAHDLTRVVPCTATNNLHKTSDASAIDLASSSRLTRDISVLRIARYLMAILREHA